MKVFLRAEIDLWCNYLNRSPLDLIGAVAQAKASGEDNELRRAFALPDHPIQQIGESMINENTPSPEESTITQELLLYAKQQLQLNDAKLLNEEIFASQFPKIAEALS